MRFRSVSKPGWALVLMLACASGGAQQSAPERQKEKNLKKMIEISWSRGPDLPQGFQDSNGGVLHHTLVSTCGFCAGLNNDKKPGRYPRGFLNKTWGLDLKNEAAGWQSLPDFPGAARQGMSAAVVNEAMYIWGGFSYSAPYCYADGCRLEKGAQGWHWEALPPLPWPVCGGMMTAIDAKIYLLGGADYDAEAFYTQADRQGNTPRLGARLLCFDTAQAERGWQALAECPGTPRWVAAMAAVNGSLYVIGGATGSPYCTVVDNWRYDPSVNRWERLRDLPVASGNFPAGAVAYQNRYILLIGGYQYDCVAHPGGEPGKPYGTPRRFQDRGEYFCDIFVYDTQSGRFGRPDALPLNNNLPMAVVQRDTLYLIGGETGGAEVDGVYYGHHPELCLKGALSEVK